MRRTSKFRFNKKIRYIKQWVLLIVTVFVVCNSFPNLDSIVLTPKGRHQNKYFMIICLEAAMERGLFLIVLFVLILSVFGQPVLVGFV